MQGSILQDSAFQKAVSSIKPRSERQPDVSMLERTYVDTGVMPQLENSNNQILYGRRGTGKSHVLRVLGLDVGKDSNTSVLYIDIRLLGSAQLMADDTRDLTVRCVSVFKDLLSLMQGQLLDVATDPSRDGSGIEEVSALSDLIMNKSVEVTSRTFTKKETSKDTSAASAVARVAPKPEIGISGSTGEEVSSEHGLSYTETLRSTVVFAEVAQSLDAALAAMGIDHLYVLIDEWPAIPMDVQPYVAEFIKRALFPSNRIAVKIASLEFRSRFALGHPGGGNPIGFELGPDISANLDLDDYYVYDRNPDNVVEMFLELLFRHVEAEIPAGYLTSLDITNAVSLRARLFTELQHLLN